MKQIETLKKKLIQRAKSNGLYENFGQNEVRQLKDRLKYNPYAVTPEEKRVRTSIDMFDDWCMNFDLSQIN